jgi:hypothetical protein
MLAGRLYLLSLGFAKIGVDEKGEIAMRRRVERQVMVARREFSTLSF